MLSEERVDIALVENPRSLGLWEDKVGEHQETEVGVEWDPGENEPCPAVKEAEAGEDHPVHEPWSQLGGIGGAEGFVGCKDREKDCDH